MSCPKNRLKQKAGSNLRKTRMVSPGHGGGPVAGAAGERRWILDSLILCLIVATIAYGAFRHGKRLGKSIGFSGWAPAAWSATTIVADLECNATREFSIGAIAVIRMLHRFHSARLRRGWQRRFKYDERGIAICFSLDLSGR